MRYYLQIIIIGILALLSASCSKRNDFKVECHTSADIQKMLVFTYPDQRGIKQTTVPLTKGKAVLTGESRTPTLVSIHLSDGTPVADCIVANGDEATITFELDPEGTGAVSDVEIDANHHTKRLLEFVHDNDSLIRLGYSDALNQAVTDFVGRNPSEPASTVVLVRYFDVRGGREQTADSLMMLLTPEARPVTLLQNYGSIIARQLDRKTDERIFNFNLVGATDSVVNIRPGKHRQTLVAFLSHGARRNAQVDSLRKLWKLRDSLRLDIVEVSLAGDTVAWRKEIANDSAGWTQAWTPGNIMAPAIRKFAVPHQPYYVLVDSNGYQIYRGDYLRGVEPEARANMKRRLRAAH